MVGNEAEVVNNDDNVYEKENWRPKMSIEQNEDS